MKARTVAAGLLVCACVGSAEQWWVVNAQVPPAPRPAAPAVPAAYVDVLEHGAICDGETDDGGAIERAVAQARSRGVPVLLPAATCAHGNVLRVDSVMVQGRGDSSVLHALDWRRSAIFLSGQSPALVALRLTARRAPSRQADWEMTRITVFGGTGFLVDRVSVEGAAAAGIQTADGAKGGRIVDTVVRDTLSDGIHITGSASNITIEGNRIENTGDDGIAVVSYGPDARRVRDVVARRNVVANIRFGRNMSVVGGEHVLYEHNLLLGNLAGLACLYVAQENGVPTWGSSNVRLEHNRLERCGGSSTHAAVMIYSDGGQPTENVRLVRNDLELRKQAGIRVFGTAVRGIVLDANRVVGANPSIELTAHDVQVTPYVSGPVGSDLAR